MLNLLQEIRLETLETVAAVALLAALIAAIAGLRKAWRVCREDADGKVGGQFLLELAHHGFETLALTFLIVFTVALIGLFYWSTLPDLHAISPALI